MSFEGSQRFEPSAAMRLDRTPTANDLRLLATRYVLADR